MDDAPSSFDIDACAAPAADGGVSPSMIPIPKIDPDELETAASALRTAGENIEETAGDIKASWGALTPVYEAPESETLLSALDPVTVDASDVATVTEDAAWALEGFAINARSIKQTLIDLKEEAEEFRAEVGWDDEWLDDEIHRATNNGINNRVAEAVQAYQEAERECANAIGEHYDGTLFSGYSDKARHDQTEVPGERDKELYGVSGDTLDQTNPWGSSIEEPTGHLEDSLAGVGTFAVDFVVGAGMATGVWRDGQAAYPFGTEWGENMGANWSEAQETFWAVLGSNAQGEWEDPGGWQAQWDNSQAALAEIGDSIVPVSEFDDRPGFTVTNGTLNVLSMISPSSWIRVSGDTSGGFDTGTPDADGTGGDRGSQGTSPTTPGGAGGTDTVPSPDPPATHPDLTSSLQSMDESLQRLDEQLGGGQGGSPGPGAEAPTPPATPEGPGPAGPGDGSGPGSEGRGDGSSGTQAPAPTPHDSTPGEGGSDPSGSTTPEGGSGRGESDGGTRGEPEPGTREGTDIPPREGSEGGQLEGSPDRSGTQPDPTSQELREGTRDAGADRSSDPWTASPDGQSPSPEAPALRNPDEEGARPPRSDDSDNAPPSRPNEDSKSPAPSTGGDGNSGSEGGTGGPPAPPGGDGSSEPSGPGGSDGAGGGPPGGGGSGSGDGSFNRSPRGPGSPFQTTAREDGPLPQSRVQELHNSLKSDLGLRDDQATKISQRLSQSDMPQGSQIAEILMDTQMQKIEGLGGKKGFATKFEMKSEKHVIDNAVELRLAHDLVVNQNIPPEKVSFPDNNNDTKEDVDIAVQGSEASEDYAYQVKNLSSPKKIFDRLNRIERALPDGVAENRVGVIEIPKESSTLNDRMLERIASSALEKDMKLVLAFSDTVITIPSHFTLSP